MPPWSSTKRRATARPSPVPRFLPRVTKGRRATHGSGRHTRSLVGQAELQQRAGRSGSTLACRWQHALSAHGVLGVGRDVADHPRQLVGVEAGRGLRRQREVAATSSPGNSRAQVVGQVFQEAAAAPPCRRTTRPPSRAKSSVSAVMRSRRSTASTMRPARCFTSASSAGGPASEPRVAADHGERAAGSRGPACRPWCPARPCARSPDKDDYRSAVWLAPADGSAPPRQLTLGRKHDSAPRWSPDGRTLAFLSDRSAVLRAGGGADEPRDPGARRARRRTTPRRSGCCPWMAARRAS